MHIPDGYLSPQTCAVMAGAATPFWVAAARRVRRVVTTRYVPLLAMGAAYCFLVMMFNVPVPDGTTAHAVGAVLVAVLLGPWAAIVAVSTALLVQALFFGDGGVLVYGANCFNMAIVMPLVGYGLYKLLARGASLTAARRALAAGIAAYAGINAAALCTAVELGVQPDLFQRADGTPLYAPFHLGQAVPAMLFAHLLVAGPVELVLTMGVVRYLQRANVPVLRINHGGVPTEREPSAASRYAGWRWAWVGLATMVVLTPLGLLAPGGAFGEDRPADLDLHRYGLGAVPDGLAHYAGFFHNALFDGYGFADDAHPAVGYLVSAAVGLLAIAAVAAGTVAAARLWRSRRRAVLVASGSDGAAVAVAGSGDGSAAVEAAASSAPDPPAGGGAGDDDGASPGMAGSGARDGTAPADAAAARPAVERAEAARW
jgi:cobalt/nickel transport system permease protein